MFIRHCFGRSAALALCLAAAAAAASPADPDAPVPAAQPFPSLLQESAAPEQTAPRAQSQQDRDHAARTHLPAPQPDGPTRADQPHHHEGHAP